MSHEGKPVHPSHPGHEEDFSGIEYEIHDVQVSFGLRQATVVLKSKNQGMVFVNQFPFDPPGEQTETALRILAVKEARRRLLAAAEFLG